jgi:hypothetical protein
MKLFKVSDGDRDLWVAALLGDRMYVYIDNTGRFHRNDALSEEYLLDQDLAYERIGVSQARGLMAQHVGRGDDIKVRDQLARYHSDPNPLKVDIVLAQVANA